MLFMYQDNVGFGHKSYFGRKAPKVTVDLCAMCEEIGTGIIFRDFHAF